MVIEGFESGCDSDMIYLDIKKAFDSVAHEELLFKLWRMGITGTLWKWFQNYLLNRQHYVSYQGAASSKMPVRSGVPQGSILGPLLFLIYINDVQEAIKTSSDFIFADDTKLLHSCVLSSDSDFLQEEIDNVCFWCTTWNLHLSTINVSISTSRCVLQIQPTHS